MKRLSWEVYFGISLLTVSAIIFFIHYLVFRDTDYIFMYLIADIALVPVNVLLVTIGIQQILNRREKQLRLNKMHMVIGAFFSEVGTELLEVLSGFDVKAKQHRANFMLSKEWFVENFRGNKPRLKEMVFELDSAHGDMAQLRELLLNKKDFLLRLLENPTLLEHEAFTDLLWAVFHIAEELSCRDNINTCNQADQDHLSVDLKRAYQSLIVEWLIHLKYLSQEYPYLFSLAMRTNPFDPNASVEIK